MGGGEKDKRGPVVEHGCFGGARAALGRILVNGSGLSLICHHNVTKNPCVAG